MTRFTGNLKAPQARRYSPKPLAAIIAALTVGLAPAAAAQQLEEIIVTATKRAESVQDIPMAISVLGEETLETSISQILKIM